MLALAALAVALAPVPLYAHGAPTPLDFWGAFGRRVARCQRIIGRSAAACALHAWSIQRDCRLNQLHGIPCDEDAAQAAVEAVRIAAVDQVAANCTEQQAITLVFLGTREAEQDVVNFCRRLEKAATSAVFLPVPADPAAAQPQVRTCVEAAARVTTKLLRRAFDSRQRLLDRIALSALSLPRKRAMVAESTTAIGGAAGALELLMADACSETDFHASYGRSAATFLATIASRADCLAGGTYAQGGVVCPPQECGNGMLEIGSATQLDEECDDGNLTDGDGCSASCLRE